MNKIGIDGFLLLLLDEFNGRLESETRIQKLAFLAKEEGGIDLGIRFKWHHYGPFSGSLKNCLSNMKGKKLLKVEKKTRTTFFGDPYTIHVFQLTNSGRFKVSMLKKHLSQACQQKIRNLTMQYGYRPLDDLLNHVYKTYSPDDL